MREKKRNSVFFQASGWKEGCGREKSKNENLIVMSSGGENAFSFFEFPSCIQEARFDPEYAERVANSGNGTFSLVGWPEPGGNLHQIYFRAYLTTLQNLVFVSAVSLPIGDAVFAYDGLLPLPDGSVFQIAPWGDWDAMQAAISAAQKRRDASERSADWTARMSTESKSEVEKRFGVDLQKRWKDKGRGIPEIEPMPEPAEVSSPEVSSVCYEYRLLEKGEVIQEGDEVDGSNDGWRDAPKWKPVHPSSIGEAACDPAFPSHRIYRRKVKQVSSPPSSDTEPEGRMPSIFEAYGITPEESMLLREWAMKSLEETLGAELNRVAESSFDPRDAGPEVAAAAGDAFRSTVDRPASLPPGFVAVPLPDDGKPVLDYGRKPGHYLTRGGCFVDLTYNVGTGIDQHSFPWVHFDKHRRGSCHDVFFTVHGEAYQATRVGSGEFPLCHYDHLPDFDIVQKCVHPAAKESREGPQAESKFVVTPDKPLQAVVPVEHYNQTAEQFSKFRGEVGQAFAMLAKAFGVCDCRCGGEGGEGGVVGGATNHAREDLESKLSESRAEVHALNKRIAELARALGGEKQVSVELDAKCDRLTEQWVWDH